MYRIIGADGKEYGPVPADQLARWLAEGRVEANTRVAVVGSSEWRTLGSFPEFAYALASSAGVSTGMVSSPVQKSNPMAVAGLIMGVLSLLSCLCCYGIPFNLLGVVFSLVALTQINRNPELYTGKGAAIAGLVLSLLSIILCVVFMLTMGFAQWEEWIKSRPR